jgi:hypothetical protein
MVGRESGETRLEVLDPPGSAEPGGLVARSCLSGTTVNTGERVEDGRVGGRHERVHVTADHSGPEGTWAIDADGGGIREVHCNTMEGSGRAFGACSGHSGGEQAERVAVRSDVRVGAQPQGSEG